MIDYLVDTSAVWRLGRDDTLLAAWAPSLSRGAVGSCAAQRTEFYRSAQDMDEYDQYHQTFDSLFLDVAVPKTAWRWMDSAQYRLLRAGAHSAFSVVDLLICATAAGHGLIVLHDDNDFVTAARHLVDVRERRVHLVPDVD